MRSQNSVLAHTTKSLTSLTLTTNQSHTRDQHTHRSTTPIGYIQNSSTLPACGTKDQMTTGSGLSGGNSNSVAASQKSNSSTLPVCNSMALNNNHKSSTITRHSNGNLSSNNSANSSAPTTNNINSKANGTNNNCNNQNPNWSKLQTLEQRKLELEKLLNEKNWLLAQIHKQEAQILNGNYENFHLLETGKVAPGTTNSILRRKGSSSLKLNKNNVHFNGKNNRLTLSKSEYDLAQENKHNSQLASANPNVINVKKRQTAPLKTNSFHDNTSTSALSLTKSPSFEYNGNVAPHLTDGSTSHSIKYSMGRPHGSTENLTNSVSGAYSSISQQQTDNRNPSIARSVTQCDKYYLSPTSQMYTDGSGFIKASQNIKQCLSPSPMHKIIALNDTAEAHRNRQQQTDNSHNLLVHHNGGSQPHLEQYENVDALSLSPSTICAFDQVPISGVQHANLWRSMSANDRAAWCDTTSYVELDNEMTNSYHNMKPLPKKMLPTSLSGSTMQHSPESTSLGNFYPVGGPSVAGYPNAIEKTCDEMSISSVNSETNKKPKNKQWMESSLDGPIIRPNILQQNSSSLVDANASQYNTYYTASSQTTSPNSVLPSGGGKMTPSPGQAPIGGSLLAVASGNSRPPTRTLTHHSHPHHKQGYRERTKLSSQSMSSGSYRAPKGKLEDDNNHLSHSTSYLNVDPYHHHNHFHLQPAQQQQQPLPQLYHHNHYLMDISNSNAYPLPHLQLYQQQQPQKPTKQLVPPSTSPLPKFSPTIQHPHTDGSSLSSSRSGGQNMPKNPMQMPYPNPVQQAAVSSTTSPDIRIESPKNMTVVQQATFLPYKEVTKPFEMSDFYKYSTKFRQKEANAATMSKNST